MMTSQSQNSSKLFSLVLLILAVVFTGLTTAELLQISRSSDQDSVITEGLLDQIRPDEKTAQRFLNQYQKAAEQLARNNSFVLPAASVPPGDCTAIFGDEARFGSRWVKTGDTLGDAKVLEVGVTVVTLEWGGKILKRSPVPGEDKGRKSSSRGRSGSSKVTIVTNRKEAGGGIATVYTTIMGAVKSGKLSPEDAYRKMEGGVRDAVMGGEMPRSEAGEILMKFRMGLSDDK